MDAIELVALGAGIAVFVVLLAVALREPPDRSERPRGERFIPGDYHGHDSGDGGGMN